MANYVTRQEVKDSLEIKDDNRDALIDSKLPQGSRLVDKWTRVPTDGWTDLQAKTITTQAINHGDKYLFLPLRIQSITSVTHDGVALTEGPDEDFVRWPWYLDRIAGAKFGPDFVRHSGWTSRPQKIVVVGNFGSAVIPDEVKYICTEAVSIITGLKKHVFQTNEGVQGASTVTNIPEIVRDAVGAIKRRHEVPAYLIT